MTFNSYLSFVQLRQMNVIAIREVLTTTAAGQYILDCQHWVLIGTQIGARISETKENTYVTSDRQTCRHTIQMFHHATSAIDVERNCCHILYRAHDNRYIGDASTITILIIWGTQPCVIITVKEDPALWIFFYKVLRRRHTKGVKIYEYGI